jgi:hypothetical protein
MTTIIGIKLENRVSDALKLQKIITGYGCEIQNRIGLHPVDDYECNNYGIILIEVKSKVNEIYDALAKYWQIQMMKF